VLRSTITVDDVRELPAGRLLSLRVVTTAWRPDAEPLDVLDWRPVAVAA
jgi:hypothetical protein